MMKHICFEIYSRIYNVAVISTGAAGVGTSTKLVAWRQSAWNNLLLAPRGPSVDVFERNTWEPWDEVFNDIAEDIAKL